MCRLKSPLTIFVFATLLSACSVLPKPLPPESTYDFGPPPSSAASLTSQFPHNVVLGNVTATPWLQSEDIYYRFAYADDVRLRHYARSRWLSSPPSLLDSRLSDAITASNHSTQPIPQHVTLNVALHHFEQIFVSPKRSYVLMQVQVTIIEPTNGSVLRAHVFHLTRKATFPNASGAVHALSATVSQFLSDLAEWLREADVARSSRPKERALGANASVFRDRAIHEGELRSLTELRRAQNKKLLSGR